MTTTVKALGGGAQPASIDTSGKVAGGAALRVYGFDSVEAAQAAGYVCEGGPAMSVALITDAQIASGAWKAEGDPAALVVYTAPSNMPVEGGYALPVYSVNGWGSAAPVPVPPLFSSAEVGTVNASTVVVTFDQDISAADYSAGVTIKVNGSGATISSATRQSNHAIVYYVLSAAVVFGDVVTWEYVEASGNIVAEDDSTPLANVTAQSVTNNVAQTIDQILRAACKAYWKFDEASGSRADATGRGNNLSDVHTNTSGVAALVGNGSKFDQDIVSPGKRLRATANADLTMMGHDYYIAFWLKVDRINTTQRFVCRFDHIEEEFSIELDSSSSGVLDFSLGNNGYVLANTFGAISTGVWYWIDAYYRLSDDSYGLAVNNGSFDAETLPDLYVTTVPFTIGTIDADDGADGYFTIDEAYVSHTIPDQAGRDYLYNSGVGRTLYP